MTLKKILFLLTGLLFLITSKAQQSQTLDSLAVQIIEQYNIKGIAMVGVKNDKVIYSKGFGFANESYKMTKDTPFYIASNTKAFIGFAMAQLIAKGKLNLDDPIVKYIDRGYFTDSIQIEEVTIKDALAHTTGLSNDPITFRTAYSGEYPKHIQELLEFTVYKDDNATLVKEFNYSNFGYLLCGILIEETTGITWKDYIMNHVLPFLDMKNTAPFIPKGEKHETMAVPYIFNQKAPLKSVKRSNTLHAAGGLYTNLNDMAKWLIYHTSHNSLDTTGNDLVPNKNYFKPLTSADESLGPIKVTGYGYGWYFGHILGTPINFHTGGFSAHNSFISYLPDEDLGFFVFLNERTNLKLAGLQLAFQFYAENTSNSQFSEIVNMFPKRLEQIKERYKKRNLQMVQSTDMALHLGTFINNKYGTLKIDVENNKYIISLGKNLKSYAFRGEKENEFLTEFVPDSYDSFFIEATDNGLRIKYGENYGYFYPLEE